MPQREAFGLCGPLPGEQLFVAAWSDKEGRKADLLAAGRVNDMEAGSRINYYSISELQAEPLPTCQGTL